MAAVEIRNVEKYFGATHVIRGVNIEIEDGQFTVLVGPSGCGKSTLLQQGILRAQHVQPHGGL